MNLRHTITLAVIGWYLMVPPTQEALDANCDGNAWNAYSVYHGILSLVAGCSRKS
jgi:hypothetical protein